MLQVRELNKIFIFFNYPKHSLKTRKNIGLNVACQTKSIQNCRPTAYTGQLSFKAQKHRTLVGNLRESISLRQLYSVPIIQKFQPSQVGPNYFYCRAYLGHIINYYIAGIGPYRLLLVLIRKHTDIKTINHSPPVIQFSSLFAALPGVVTPRFVSLLLSAYQ